MSRLKLWLKRESRACLIYHSSSVCKRDRDGTVEILRFVKHDISGLKRNAWLGDCREHTNFVNCIRFSPDGSKFLSVGSDKNGFLFDGKTGGMLGALSSEDGHNGSIYAGSWSPNGKQVNSNPLMW